MKDLLVAALFLSLPAHAGALPEIYVTEVPIADGGIYTVTINQPPSPPGETWFMAAWGIVNNDAVFAETMLTGWTAEIFDVTSWESGITFETGTPDGSLYLFESGVPGVSDVATLTSQSAGQVVLYWNDIYFGNPLPATSSNFTWSDGSRWPSRGFTTAFALISSPQETLICRIGIGGPVGLVCQPIDVPNDDEDGDGVPDLNDNCTLAPNPNQEDEDFDGFGNACDPDLNSDFVVNVVDLGLLRSVFFTGDPVADFNSDGVVNVVDLGIMRSYFFQSPGPSAFGP